MYARGSKVSSSRARPTKPIDDSGSSASAESAMPRPARSTGTISGGLASRVPWVGATGVVIGYCSVAKERAASSWEGASMLRTSGPAPRTLNRFVSVNAGTSRSSGRP